MAILIDKASRVIVQGLSGRAGRFHAKKCLEYGTNIVGGVAPKKGGECVLEKPLFHSMQEAKNHLSFNVSLLFVPPEETKNAVAQALEVGVDLIVCTTTNLPVSDLRVIRKWLDNTTTIMIGPASAGIINPGTAMVGRMPPEVYLEGNIGVISRAATLGYEVCLSLTKANIGQSSFVCLGRDPFLGSDPVELFSLLSNDPATKAILYLTENTFVDDDKVIAWIAMNKLKPVFVYLADNPTKEYAELNAALPTVQEREARFQQAGAHIVESPHQITCCIQQKIGTDL